MNITQWAINNNRVTYSIVVLTILLGIVAFIGMPKAQDPGFTIRIATVTTKFPGASAKRVEELVTDKLEEKIQEMPEIDEITSESKAGLSVINVAFQDKYVELQPIFDDLRQKVESITPDLPAGVKKPEINDEFGDTFGHLYSLTGNGFTSRELYDYARDIRDVLLKEDDIAKVQLFGVQKEAIFIEYNNAHLAALGLTPNQVSLVLQKLNILASGGDITINRERIPIEPTGNLDTIADIENAVISLPNNQGIIRLGDIAEVIRKYEDPASEIVHINGEPGISIAISLKDGGNLINLGQKLSQLMPTLEQALPLGVTVTPQFLQSKITENSVSNFISNMVQSVLIILVVMFVSLGFRTGVVVASLIPVVILSTFIVMPFFDISINKISLAALIISLGLLVDNAIVIAEATILRREKGMGAINAAIDAAKEMKVPLLISSLTTVVAFGPVGLGDGSAGEFTRAIFVVVAIALILSWAYALTFIPLMTKFIKVKNTASGTDAYTGKFFVNYRSVLIWALKKPLAVIAIVIALFVIAIMGLKPLPKMFIPPSDDPYLTVKMTLPSGTDIEATEQAIERFEDFLKQELLLAQKDELSIGIHKWTSYIGTGGPRFVLGYTPPNPNDAEANVIINLNNPASLDPMKAKIEEYFWHHEPDAQIQVKRLAQGPPFAYPIEIKISGDDHKVLFDIAAKVKEQLWKTEGVTVVTDDWGAQSKKIILAIDQARAYRAGLSNDDIANSLKGSLTGLDVTEFREGIEVIPIKIRSQEDTRENIVKIENHMLFSKTTNASVPLSQVVTPKLVWEPGRLKRLDRQLMITIQVQIDNGLTSEAVARTVMPWVENYAKTWPTGYSYSEGGEADASAKGAEPIAKLIPYAFVGIILLLLLQFNSFRKATIVLMIIPLGLIGISFGLNVARSYFGFFTVLGLISLSGIVINNAIVLLDRIKLEIDENGLTESEAILEAAQQRARPILLTTATTIGGMLPLWISGGSMFSTMAIAILFGLLFATILTLIFVPVLYSLFFKVDTIGIGRKYTAA